MPPLALETLPALAGRALVLCLLHSVWIGLFALVIAGLAVRRMRAKPARRYACYVAAFTLTALAPAAFMTWQRATASPPVVAQPRADASIVVVAGDVLAGMPRAERESAPVRTAPQESSSDWNLRAVSAWCGAAVRAVEPWILRAWAALAAVLVLRLALGFHSVSRLLRQARPAARHVTARAYRLARALNLKRLPDVRVHDQLAEPCLIGVRKPMVLIPTHLADTAPPELLDAVIAHELGHARRGDLLANLLQRGLEICYCLNPAFQALSNELRRQREICCDALATRATNNPLALAQVLEMLARERIARPKGWRLVTALGGGSSTLCSRIQEMLGMMPNSKQRPGWLFALLPFAAVVALATTSLGWPQEPQQQAPPSDKPASILERSTHDSKRILEAPPIGAPRLDPAVRVVKLPSPGTTDPTRSAREFRVAGDQVAPTQRQVCFEVAFLDVDLHAWRDAVLGAVTTAKRDSKMPAWTADEATAQRLREVALSDPKASILQAPKATAFEAGAVSIMNVHDFHFIAEAKPIATESTLTFQPTVKAIEVGTTLSMSGRVSETGVALTASVRDKGITSVDTFGVPGSIVDKNGKSQTVVAQVQLPAWKEDSENFENDLASGETLLVSLGTYESGSKLSDGAEFLVDLVAVLGGPKLESARTLRERLVLITPRPIVIEAEEEPIK